VTALRILIIAGTAGIRGTLAEIVAADPELEVMGTVPDPLVAARRLREEAPDAIILDMETPRFEALTFLAKLREQSSLPVVMISAKAAEGSPELAAAIEAGATDIMLLPDAGARVHLLANADAIRDNLKAVVKDHRRAPAEPPSRRVQPKLTADAILPPPARWVKVKPTEPIICIGVSTGGTESLQAVLQRLPSDCPGVVAVQHMPENFTATFARRLDKACRISVKEAADNDPVLPGHALIAPGNRHTLLVRRGDRYVVEVKDGPLVSRHRPSVDVLFRSAARSAGPNAVGVIMTGMGDDGARGLLEMHEAGASTIAEHESTAVVYGMPKEAIARGGVDKVVPLARIAAQILAFTDQRRR
jgi:two-component system chemotaxis response regulator CheB